MDINDDNKSPLNDFYVTSISKDEAVQKLLGWQINCGPSGDHSDEEQEGAGNAGVTVLDVFEDQRTDLENALFEAKHAELPDANIIAEKEAALAEFDKKIDQAKRYFCAIDDELSKGDASALRLDKNRPSGAEPYITIHSFNEWAKTKLNFGVQLFSSADQVAQPVSDKPWLLHSQGDPDPVQPWYTPARYFARLLVIESPRLLADKARLAEKVVPFLAAKQISKRGGKKPPQACTVLKAFSNVLLG